jgi:hypothetical protein
MRRSRHDQGMRKSHFAYPSRIHWEQVERPFLRFVLGNRRRGLVGFFRDGLSGCDGLNTLP